VEPMIRIEGKQLEDLIAMLTNPDRPPHLLRINWRGESAAFKVNEGGWTPSMGTKQEPY
jgi:hypothetical protein